MTTERPTLIPLSGIESARPLGLSRQTLAHRDARREAEIRLETRAIGARACGIAGRRGLEAELRGGPEGPLQDADRVDQLHLRASSHVVDPGHGPSPGAPACLHGVVHEREIARLAA